MLSEMIQQLEAHEAVYPTDESGNALQPKLPSVKE